MLLLIWFTALLIEIRRTKEALMNLYNNNYTHNCMHVCLTNNKCWLEAGARTTKPWTRCGDCTSEAAGTPQPAGGRRNPGAESQLHCVLEVVNFYIDVHCFYRIQ